MPTPPKPVIVLEHEKKSHRTKKELENRKKAEAALLTGAPLAERPEVKSNPVAHKEFLRLNKLLAGIGKNDAIYEGVINRYCLLVAECHMLESKANAAYRTAEDLEKRLNGDDLEPEDVSALAGALADVYSAAAKCDKQLQAKRKMLFDIEKENIMTIAAALRSIPKKEETAVNPLLAALNDG